MDFGFSFWLFCTWASEVLISKNLTLQKFGDGFDHSRDLLFAEFGIHRQRKNFLRGALRVREVAGLVT